MTARHFSFSCRAPHAHTPRPGMGRRRSSVPRIEEPYSGAGKVLYVARHQSQVMIERGSGN